MVKVSDLCICEKLDFPRLSLYNYIPRRTTLSSGIETNKCCSLTSLLTSLWSSLPSSSSCHHLTLSTPSILCSVQGWRLRVQSLAALAVRAQDGVLYQPTVGRRGEGNDGGGDCAAQQTIITDENETFTEASSAALGKGKCWFGKSGRADERIRCISKRRKPSTSCPPATFQLYCPFPVPPHSPSSMA